MSGVEKMSYQRGVAAIHLEPTDCLPQVEWLGSLSAEALRWATGLDPYQNPQAAYLAFIRKYDLDLLWRGLPEPNPNVYFESGQMTAVTAEGHRVSYWGISGTMEWREGGAHLRVPEVQTVEDVLNFDPLAYDTRTVEELVVEFQTEYRRNCEIIGDTALPTGELYTTLFHWGIACFGWELFMMAAAYEPKRYGRVIDGFVELSKRQMTAWSMVEDIQVVISHDDLCMTRGPVFHPDWYRQYIFPRYPEIWAPLKEKGIKVLFCSDGNLTPLVDDIAAAGADGFIVEPLVDLNWLVEKYGGKKIIIGNVDTKVLTFGSVEDIRAEVMRCVKTAGHYPGYFLNVSGQIPYNVPLENLKAYFDICAEVRGK
jgi:hypothetical protein